MKPIQGTWGDVLPGEYVRDKAGMDWRVDVLTASRLEMVSREGKAFKSRPPQPEAPVTRLVNTPEEAAAIIVKVFGPVTPVHDGKPAIRVEAFADKNLQAMKMHLHMFHGISGSGVDDSRSRKEMTEAHDFAHERNQMFFNHIHLAEGEFPR